MSSSPTPSEPLQAAPVATTSAKPPVPLGPQHTDTPDLVAYRETLLAFSPFTGAFNMSGQPSMSVPLHWSDAGNPAGTPLPLGVQLVAATHREDVLLRVASQLESARGDRRTRLPAGLGRPVHWG